MSEDIRKIRTVWTEEVVDYITMQRNNKNAKWSQIVRRLQQHYNITTTVKNAMNQYHKRKKQMESENMNWKNEPATRKQCNYIAGLTLPNGSKKLKKTLEDQLYDKSLVGEFTKNMASERIQSLESQSLATNSDNGSRRWTILENNAIMGCHSAMSAVALKLPNRTESAVRQRYYILRRKAKSNSEPTPIVAKKQPNTQLHKTELPQKIETFVEKHGNPTTRHLSNDEKEMFEEVKEVLEEAVVERKHLRSPKTWKTEEDFDLLCNFYELSILEAKERYGRDYGTIASRLESLFESTQPKHMSLLMEASAFIKARKAEEIESYKNGYFKRRKAAKMAKKQLKKERKAEKLEAKLKKLRGE